jgi:hypothetical protein
MAHARRPANQRTHQSGCCSRVVPTATYSSRRPRSNARTPACNAMQPQHTSVNITWLIMQQGLSRTVSMRLPATGWYATQCRPVTDLHAQHLDSAVCARECLIFLYAPQSASTLLASDERCSSHSAHSFAQTCRMPRPSASSARHINCFKERMVMARARQGSHTAWCRTRPGLRRARRYAQQVWRAPPRLSSSLRASPSMRCRWSTACAEDGIEYAIGVRKRMRAAYSSSAFTAISAFAASFPCCVASSHSFSSAAKASNVAAKSGCFDGDFPGGIQSAFMWQSSVGPNPRQCASGWQSPSVPKLFRNMD